MKNNYELYPITGIENYGIFVKTKENQPALCHKSKLQNVPQNYRSLEYIWAKEIESEKSGKRAFMEAPKVGNNDLFDEYISMHSEGDIITGQFAYADERSGTFITIYPGITALLHKTEYDDRKYNEEKIRESKIITVQIGKIDRVNRCISLLPPNKKNKYKATGIRGIPVGAFIKNVEVSDKFCELYRECVDDYLITKEKIKQILEEAYADAVSKDEVIAYPTKFTFPLQTKSKYGSVITIGGRRNQYKEGKNWFVNFAGSAAEYIASAMDLFAYIDDWQKLLKSLSEVILEGETWSYNLEEKGDREKDNYFILKQYLNYTFYNARNQGLLLITPENDFAAFNTGLVDAIYESIYICFVPSDEGMIKKWRYAGFCTCGTGSLGKMINAKFAEAPKRVKYFNSMSDMVYDTEKKLNWDKEHILLDNLSRLPVTFIEEQCDGTDLRNIGEIIEKVKNNEDRNNNFDAIKKYIEENPRLQRRLLNRLDDAVELAIKRCEWNYKTAIPVYYHVTNGISLLLPLCLTEDEYTADVALVVVKQESGNYQGQTILTLQMAYLSARTVCRPNSEWLKVGE